MAENMKTTLQKHENSITAMESRLEQVHLVVEEEAHRNTGHLDEVKNQMAYLTSTTEQNNKKVDDLLETMEFFKRSWKGKDGENLEAASSSRPKQGAAKSTGYPPGFSPHTPTNFATQNDLIQSEEARRSKTGFVVSMVGDGQFIPDPFQMQHLHHQDSSKVRPPQTQNPQYLLPQNTTYSAPQPQSMTYIPQNTPLPPLLQQYYNTMGYPSEAPISTHQNYTGFHNQGFIP